MIVVPIARRHVDDEEAQQTDLRPERNATFNLDDNDKEDISLRTNWRIFTSSTEQFDELRTLSSKRTTSHPDDSRISPRTIRTSRMMIW